MDALAGYASSDEEQGPDQEIPVAGTKLEQKAEIEEPTNEHKHEEKEDVKKPLEPPNNKVTDRPDSLNLPTSSSLFASLPAPSSKRPHLIPQKPLIMETYSSDEEVVVKNDGSKRRKATIQHEQEEEADTVNHAAAEYDDDEGPGGVPAVGNELYRVDVGPMPLPAPVSSSSFDQQQQPNLSPVEALLKQQLKDTSIQFTEVSAATLRGSSTGAGAGHAPASTVEPEYIEKLRRETAGMKGKGAGAVGKSIQSLYKLAKVQELEDYEKGGQRKGRFDSKKSYGW